MGPQCSPTRVLVDAHVDNEQLVAMVAAAARNAWPRLSPGTVNAERWPRLLWAFCRECVSYEAERGTQRIRMPWALISDGIGDCKSTAVFIASMCRAAGLRAVLRFSVAPGDEHYSHVYAVINGKPVDPLLSFGAEAVALRSIDVQL